MFYAVLAGATLAYVLYSIPKVKDPNQPEQNTNFALGRQGFSKNQFPGTGNTQQRKDYVVAGIEPDPIIGIPRRTLINPKLGTKTFDYDLLGLQQPDNSNPSLGQI